MILLCSLNITQTAVYKFCFDNTFSRMSEKIVFFELSSDADDEDEDIFQDVVPEETAILDMRIESLRVSGVTSCDLLIVL
jgi:hypothetical protein